MRATVAFWNRWRLGNAERQCDYLASCPVAWDVLLLAEMTPRAFRIFVDRLQPTSSAFALDHADATDMKQPHGVAIVATHGFTLRDVRLLPGDDSDPETCPRPERFLAAGLEGTAPTVVAWHAPYAAGRGEVQKRINRRRKQRGYQQVNEWLSRQDRSQVLGMDGNNCGDRLDDAAPVIMGDEWDDERRFHASGAAHELVDTLRRVVLRDPDRCANYVADEPLAVTHCIPSGGHRMDRIYAGPALEVIDAGVEYHRRQFDEIENKRQLTAGSDHALVWAALEV